MGLDEDLELRIRAMLGDDPDVSERRMFGGLAFLTAGHMAVAASGQGGLMVRVEPAQTEAMRAEPGAGPMIMQGREIKGWVRVAVEAVQDDARLREWVERGVGYARSLPQQG